MEELSGQLSECQSDLEESREQAQHSRKAALRSHAEAASISKALGRSSEAVQRLQARWPGHAHAQVVSWLDQSNRP